MVKTAEFGQPVARVPAPGRCRICDREADHADFWIDDTKTLCRRLTCLDEARKEIGR